jgi:hypothetical protein
MGSRKVTFHSPLNLRTVTLSGVLHEAGEAES